MKTLRSFLSLRACVAVLIFAVFVAWSLGGSLSFQTCVLQHYDKASKQNAHDYVAALFIWLGFDRECLGHFAHENGDALVAGFTLVLAFSTILLWFATRDVVTSAEKNSRIVERAYIAGGGIRQIIVAPVPGAPNQFRQTVTNDWEFRVANHGKTMGELITPVEWNFCDLAAVPNLPKRPSYIYSKPFNDKVLPGTADRPLFATPILGSYPNPVIYGRYWYLDVWGAKCETRFILRILPNQPIPEQIDAPIEYRLTT
jgi:hypothetical protein